LLSTILPSLPCGLLSFRHKFAVSFSLCVDEVEGEEEVKRKLKEYYAENEQRWKDRSLTGKHRII